MELLASAQLAHPRMQGVSRRPGGRCPRAGPGTGGRRSSRRARLVQPPPCRLYTSLAPPDVRPGAAALSLSAALRLSSLRPAALPLFSSAGSLCQANTVLGLSAVSGWRHWRWVGLIHAHFGAPCSGRQRHAGLCQ